MRQWIPGMAAAALLLATLNAEPLISERKLQDLAATAKTPAQHASVAKQYRLRAEALEREAMKHESNLKEVAPHQQPAMATKWPAMWRGAQSKEADLAVQKRRAAREAREFGDKHSRLAVEALAADE